MVLSALLCVVVVGALFLTDRPAVAAKVTEIILPDITPLQEDDWTIPLTQQIVSVPESTPTPTPAPQAAVQSTPAPITYNSYTTAAPSEPVYVPESTPTVPAAPPVSGDIIDSGGF